MLNKTHLNSGLWLFYREIVSLLLKLFGTLYLIKIIGSSEYGIYVITSSLILFLMILPQLGVNVFLIKKDNTYTTPALLLMIIISSCVFIIGILFRELFINIIKHPEILYPYLIMLIAIPFSLLKLVPLSILEKEFKFKILAKTESEAQILFIVISIAFSFLGLGAKSCAIGFLFMHVYVSVKLFIKANLRLDINDIKKDKIFDILKFGVNFGQYLAVNELRNLILPFIVAPNFSTTIIGYVGVVDKSVESVNSFSNVFRRLSIPILSNSNNSTIHQITQLMVIQAITMGLMFFLLNLCFPIFIQHYMIDAVGTTAIITSFICFSTFCKSYATIPTSYLNINGLNGRLSLVLLFQYILMIFVFTLSRSYGIISYGLLQTTTFVTLMSLCVVIKGIDLKPTLLIFFIISLAIFYKFAILFLLFLPFCQPYRVYLKNLEQALNQTRK